MYLQVKSLLEEADKISIKEHDIIALPGENEVNKVYEECVKLTNKYFTSIYDKANELLTCWRSEKPKYENCSAQRDCYVYNFVTYPNVSISYDKDILIRDTDINFKNHVLIKTLPKILNIGTSIQDITHEQVIDLIIGSKIKNLCTRNCIRGYINETILKASNSFDSLDEDKNVILTYIEKASSNKDKMLYILDAGKQIASVYALLFVVYAKVNDSLMNEYKCFGSDNSMTLTESATEEDAKKYISELKELIPKIREFHDEFEYKEIVTPRKKKIAKMTEYMLGALNRKYTLKIPLYQVVGKSTDVKNIVETKFIKPLESIVSKYPNYILMTPDWSDDSDMFIYLTLKEPFGDEEDRSDRVQQSQVQNESTDEVYKGYRLVDEGKLHVGYDPDGKFFGNYDSVADFKYSVDEELEDKKAMNEAALSGKDRAKLPNEIFGIPSIRAYPLNDKIHVQKAIQMFDKCQPKYKRTLANNIVKRVIELNLVGKVRISENNDNKKYFPNWMIGNTKPTMKKYNGKYIIYIGTQAVDEGSLNESACDVNFII